jgi:ABC-type branched-subunit amino acid transport system substrate-binding protein
LFSLGNRKKAGSAEQSEKDIRSARLRRHSRRAVGALGSVALVSTGLVFGGVGLIGPGVASASGSTITICEDLALSGTNAQLGMNDALGAEAYVKMINSKGGMDGHPVKIIQENNQSVPATAATLARKCVTQDHANFVFGPEETGTATAAIPVLNELQTVSLGWQSGWNDIGLPASAKDSYAFPGIDNVFHEDDLATVQQLVAPRHYTSVAVLEDSAPGGLGNDTYTESLESQYHFKVVASQQVTPGSTDDTPAVLALLAKKPQIIILGLIPGPDSITGIKAVRAQSPTLPISECSGCSIPSFIAATGGASAMQDVYILGAYPELADLPNNAANAATITDAKNYISAMQAAGLGSANDIDSSSEGWDTAEELDQAITTAHSTSESAVKDALEHQKIDVLGIHFARTPQNYGAITSVQTSMQTVTSSGGLKLFGFSAGGPGE